MPTKQKLLDKLKQEMEANIKLPLFDEANLVFGEGNPEAKVLFIGEAPGSHEDKLLRPFVGRAGKLLDEILDSISLPRESVYITNIVKRRPPKNRDPLPEEIKAYRPYLQKQIEIIHPKFITTLGRFAMNYFLPEMKISHTHGKLLHVGDCTVFSLYHPAAALRSRAMRSVLEKDFQVLHEFLCDESILVKDKKILR